MKDKNKRSTEQSNEPDYKKLFRNLKGKKSNSKQVENENKLITKEIKDQKKTDAKLFADKGSSSERFSKISQPIAKLGKKIGDAFSSVKTHLPKRNANTSNMHGPLDGVEVENQNKLKNEKQSSSDRFSKVSQPMSHLGKQFGDALSSIKNHLPKKGGYDLSQQQTKSDKGDNKKSDSFVDRITRSNSIKDDGRSR